MKMHVLFVLALVALTQSAASAGPVVRVTEGTLEGSTASGVDRFLGVPFALPPLGARRFTAPQPVAPYAGGHRLATQPPSSCLQEVNYVNGTGALAGSEDCLYLNVVRPAGTPAGARLPVMLWIHGGGNVAGDATTYDGSLLATRGGVIVVTIQYRLGILGWMAHPALATSNRGALDQIAALGWVRRNAAAFGGDPDNITLFGQSAGAGGVINLMASPLSRALFAKGIVQSAPVQAALLSEAQTQGRDLVRRLCGLVLNNQRVLDCLTQVSPQALLNATDAFVIADPDSVSRERFPPVIDGNVLLEHPLDTFAHGLVKPTLVGSTRDEFLIFVPVVFTQTYLRLSLQRIFGTSLSAMLGLMPGTDASLREIQLGTAVTFNCPARSLTDHLVAGGARPYSYLFAHEAVRESGQILPPFHAADIFPLFGYKADFDLPANRLLSERLQRYWLNFAHTGNPNTGPVAGSAPAWAPYQLGAPTYLELREGTTVTTTLKHNLYGPVCDSL